MQRASRVLFSNLYKHVSLLNEAPISNIPSIASALHHPCLPSPPAFHFSSIPNRPLRGDRRRDGTPEDRFLRNLNFGDDGDEQRTEKSHQGPPTQIPNRPLRGEKRLEPSRGSECPDGSVDLFPELDDRREEPSRTRRAPPARTPNRPMRGMQREEGFEASRRNPQPRFANRPGRKEERSGGSPEIGDTREGPIIGGGGDGQFGDSLLRNLKFGEDRTGEKVEETNPKALSQIAGADPAVSESSVKDADEIFKKMKETGLIPNAVAMLDGLCKDGLVQEAMKLFGLMREKGSIPEVVVYTAVVEGFCKAEKFDDAKRVFRKMQKNGILPNAFSYTVLIQGLCKGRILEDSVEFCKEMLDAGHSPNAATFTGLIEGFCTEKGVEEAECLIKGLQERGFALDEKAVREHLDKKGPFSPMVQEAIFGKKRSQTPF